MSLGQLTRKPHGPLLKGRMAKRSSLEVAREISAAANQDVILFNGTIARDHVLDFVNQVFEQKRHANVLLLLVTDGGDPDAAYKMARYLQKRYDRLTVLVSGYCKSAGTLIAIGAHEVALAPFGELGPLDIQTYKTDNLSGMESGLTISEAIDTLVRKSIELHREHYTKIMQSTGRVVSFTSAAKIATEFSTGLFAPIFERIDPYDVGQKARSMRIANDYGQRLARVTNNLKDGSLDKLTRGYPSHSFVIDSEEAQELFNNARALTQAECDLVESLGALARREIGFTRPLILFLSAVEESTDEKGTGNADDTADQNAVGDSGGAVGEVPNAEADGNSGSGP